MKTYRLIQREVKTVCDLRGLLEIFEEVAAEKMQKIRLGVVMSRDFYEHLVGLSQRIGVDFADAVGPRLPQVAALFVAGERGMYGDIVEKTFGLFLSYLRANPATHAYVAGAYGEELMQAYAPQVSFTALPFRDERVEPAEVSKLMDHLVAHQRVLLFYGKFHNVAVQVPASSEVSGDVLPITRETVQAVRKKRFRYLYEPQLLTITYTVAHEILALIVTGMLSESRLAKLGARMAQLDSAVETTHARLRALGREKLSLERALRAKRQLEMIQAVMARRRPKSYGR